MNCPYCSETLADGAKFCSKCGQRLPEPTPVEEPVSEMAPAEVKESYVPELDDILSEVEEQSAPTEIPAESTEAPADAVSQEAAAEPEATPVKKKEKKRFPAKKILIAAACVLAAAIVVLVIALNAGGSGDYIALDQCTGLISAKDGDTYIIYTGDGTAVDLKTENVNNVRYSLDGTVAAILMENDGENGGKLAVLRKGGLTTVVKDAYAYDISADGSTIAYVRDVEDQSGKLYLYNVAKGESTEVTGDALVFDSFSTSFALSPDGKSIAWCGDLDEDDESFRGYISVKGKAAEELGKNCLPVALSDGAKYIYYLKADIEDSEMTAYVRHKDSEEKLCTVSESAGWEVWFNADFTEALYLDDEYRTYITVKGGAKQKISGDELYHVLLPQEAVTRYTSMSVAEKYVVPYTTFAEKFLSLDGEIHFLDKDLDTERIVSDYYSYRVGGDCTSLLVVDDDDELLYVKNAAKSCDEEEVCEDLEVDIFWADSSLGKIYVLTYDEELYAFKLGKAPEKMADDVYDFAAGDKGSVLILADWSDNKGCGDLYFAKFGGDKEKVSEDVSDVSAMEDLLLYWLLEDEDYLADLYVGSGKSFAKLADEVPIY